jgi:hypothetical protein
VEIPNHEIFKHRRAQLSKANVSERRVPIFVRPKNFTSEGKF